MSRLTWDDRQYYGGADRGVVYPRSGEVEVWNGLIAITEKPKDIRQRVRYRDGVRVLNARFEDSYFASINCFTYPDVVLGARTVFNMAYRVKKANGYEIHLIYNAIASIPGGAYKQHNEVSTFTLDISTKPEPMPMLRSPSAHLIVDTSAAYLPAVEIFENLLYGDALSEPRFPQPDEIAVMFDINALFKVIDNGDGTATISAPDEVFEWLSETQAIVDWPYVNSVSEDTVRLRNF